MVGLITVKIPDEKMFNRYIKFIKDGYVQYIKFEYNFINKYHRKILDKYILNEKTTYDNFKKYLKLSILLIKQDVDCSCNRSYIELF